MWIPSPRSLLPALTSLILLAGACGDPQPDGGAIDPDPDAVSADALVPIDTSVPADAPDPGDTTAGADGTVAGGFGAPCVGNVDCNSGWCVEGPDGFVCTSECVEDCPPGFDCRGVQSSSPDVVFICLPRVQRLCAPCQVDFQCTGGACLELDGARSCAPACDAQSPCPTGYTCATDPGGDRPGTFCLPASGSCACTPEAAGTQRSCSESNALGTCFGVETCDPELGWSGCTARTPAPETCNGVDDDCNGLVDDGLPVGEPCTLDAPGIGSCPGVAVCFGPAGWVCQGTAPEPEVCDYRDNNCDGVVDSGFVTDGVYHTFDHCGACNVSCAIGFPNAAATRCQVEGGAASCVVDTCEPGFTKLNPYQCVPDIGSVCQACTSDAQCLGVDAACVALTDGAFCARACDVAGGCPEGFVCAEVPDAPAPQCLPASGSCTCDGSNTDLQRACSVTWTPTDPNQPSTTCQGFQPCTADGWGPCQLPEEVCDGVDNNCDGVVDGPFKTGDRYTALEHCGACNVSCLALSFPNAIPVCRTDTVIPTCDYECVGQAVDVNGLAHDGCECIPLPGDDLAGDGVDANCDGIDGDIERGVFVAKHGHDGHPGTIDLPVLTITRGLDLAVSQGKRDVYVATGVYSENVVLRAGIGVFGGYSPSYGDRDPLLYETALVGQAPTAVQHGTVTATNLGAAGQAPTILHGFTIFGINASNLPGANSYAIYLRDVGPSLRLLHNRVHAGAGGTGAPGTAGAAGAGGGGGGGGHDAFDTNAYSGSFAHCSLAHERPGGAGGARVCPGNVDVSGGMGGYSDCPVYGSPPSAPSHGRAGRGASPGAGGAPGWDHQFCTHSDPFDDRCPSCSSCWTPPDDNRSSGGAGTHGGHGANGQRGLGCQASSGTVIAGHWRGTHGGHGGDGMHGSGGGGGGSGGGVYLTGSHCLGDGSLGSDDVGGSGGGGGSGGCAASGGSGGQAGGGSFGVFLVNTQAGAKPLIADNLIQRGAGGAGGAGGPGGPGGQGGLGGQGGAPGDTLTGLAYQKTWCAQGGGQGGAGGAGGHGGGGGGGCGGAAYGIFVWAPDGGPPSYNANNTFIPGGQGGAGGLPGPSLGHGVLSEMVGATGASLPTNF